MWWAKKVINGEIGQNIKHSTRLPHAIGGCISSRNNNGNNNSSISRNNNNHP